MSTKYISIRHQRWLSLLFIMLAILLASLITPSCGSGSEEDEEEQRADQTSPEGLAELLYEEMKEGVFDCASPLYFGEARILEYFDESTLGPEGTIGVCNKLKEDAQSGVYAPLKQSPLSFDHLTRDAEGEMPQTIAGKRLPYIEGTAYSADETTSAHISRMVQHEGSWYVLVLLSYPRFY